jgi:hypothetical protein
VSPAADTHLVIERDGQLWAVPGAAVARLARGDGRVTVRLAEGFGADGGPEGEAGGELVADRLLALAGALAVVPAPAALGRFWDQPAVGLAIFARRPVVVIDPARPPRALVPGETVLSDGRASAGASSMDAGSQTAEDGDGRDDENP